jgi:putative redox protein
MFRSTALALVVGLYIAFSQRTLANNQVKIAAMLEKRGVEFSGFSVEVDAVQTETHPKVFESIRITYRIAAPEESRAAIERAIELSETRYCGVSAMLGKTAQISWELVLTPVA